MLRLFAAIVITLISTTVGAITVGPELIPDRHFDDSSSWGVGIGSSTVTNGHLVVINHSGFIFPVPQIATVIGESYHYSLIVDLVNNPSGGGKITVGGQMIWEPSDNIGTFAGTIVATDTSGLVFNFLNPYLGRAEFDFVSVAIATPLPPALYFFGSGLLGLIGIARRKKAA